MHCGRVILWSLLNCLMSCCVILRLLELVHFFFFDFLLYCRGCRLVDELELLLVIVWRVWFRRNKLVHSSSILSAEDTVQWAKDYIAEFRATVFVPKLQCEPPLVRWRAPSLGWLKLNTEPAFDSCRRRLGFGVVICDSKGLVMLSGSLVFDGFFSPEIAEAMAILRGVQLAQEMGFSPICI
ncbi:hypothetical protein ACOSQ3_022566 [Xanthoceras sorbifolium]